MLVNIFPRYQSCDEPGFFMPVLAAAALVLENKQTKCRYIDLDSNFKLCDWRTICPLVKVLTVIKGALHPRQIMPDCKLSVRLEYTVCIGFYSSMIGRAALLMRSLADDLLWFSFLDRELWLFM